MKRVKRKGNESRSVNVNIKVSRSEKAAIEKSADQAGKTTSSFLLDRYNNYENLLGAHNDLCIKLLKYENSHNSVFLERNKSRELVFPVGDGLRRITPKEKEHVIDVYRNGYDSYCFLVDTLKREHPNIIKKIIEDCARKEYEAKKASGNSHSPS